MKSEFNRYVFNESIQIYKLTIVGYCEIYHNFSELSSNKIKGINYEIETNETDSDVIVIAIHGGEIEKGTTKLARILSFYNHYNYYSFIEIQRNNNFSLHINSLKFDESTALEMVSKI